MLQRDFLSLRDVEVGRDGRTLVLACVPFDVAATVDDGHGPYREVFRRGAFRHVVGAPNRTELRYAHAPGIPYGFGVDLVEDANYLLGSFRVAPSDDGDRLLALVRDDQLRGVSVGYVAGQSRAGRDDLGDLTERLLVKRLPEVSVTPAAAYLGAEVLAVREETLEVPPGNAGALERERLYWRRLRGIM